MSIVSSEMCAATSAFVGEIWSVGGDQPNSAWLGMFLEMWWCGTDLPSQHWVVFLCFQELWHIWWHTRTPVPFYSAQHQLALCLLQFVQVSVVTGGSSANVMLILSCNCAVWSFSGENSSCDNRNATTLVSGYCRVIWKYLLRCVFGFCTSVVLAASQCSVSA